MMAGNSLRSWILQALVVLLCGGMLAPIAVVVVASFSGGGYLKFPPESLSLQWYFRFLGDARWLASLWNSFVIALMACVFSTAVGFLAAYAIARGAFAFRNAVVALLLMPLIVPHIVTAVAMYFLSARFGLVGFKPWIALAHSVVALPVVLIILQSTLKTIDPNLERAAMISGCSRAGVLRHVVLPLAMPGLISALLFSFLTSFDELLISLFLAGIRAETLPVRIWNSLLLEVEPTIAAVSSLLIAMTIVALVIEWTIRKMRSNELSTSH
ncbi:ABC-type spermidine/putrescine transport system permease subunit II [Aminobacter niigataensis]|uniref:ABC-type spermidine/putrescine transport system permease subunit II n=1 Tax=Aminobacter niigataensis TaxID=83265 RepID=A0ABR6L660_9HYPH|nr:ABC transporter permease [Aminobacter niigataensis]MBB4651495.1 ABC-type spermidine/putrescine transport system permease subunit II [Aminobacter niigataensis]